MEEVRRVYRSLLGREPDEEGLAVHTSVASAEASMAELEVGNRKAVDMGWLPDGWAHLGLLLQVA